MAEPLKVNKNIMNIAQQQKGGKVNNYKSPNTIKYVEDLQNENDSHKSNSKRKNKRPSLITQYTQATDQRDSIMGSSICSLAA